MALLDVSLKLLAVLALVLLNGFFVAAEFAIVKVRATQLQARAQRGDKRVKLAQTVTSKLDAYLSATQLGITLASLGLGWIGEPAVAQLIEPWLAAAGLGSPAIVHTVSFAIAFGLITFLHIVLGELAPKSLAIQRAEGVTLWTAAPLHVFYVVFRPAIWALNGVANAMLRGVGIRPVSEHEMVQSEEELRIILADAAARRALGRHRAEVVQRVVGLKDLIARQIMTPRTRVVWLDVRRPFEENMLAADEAGYSRFPVADGDLDRVVGMVHYRDLVSLARTDRPARDLSVVKRPVLIVPDTKGAEDLLKELLGRGLHMAIVTDEFGSVAGIVTLEDVFEEMFGEIRDEFDTHETESAQYRSLGEGHYVLDGLMPLHQAAQVLGLDLEHPDVTTLSGYVVSELGRLPTKGERIRLEEYAGVVREVDKKRIQTLELWRA